MILSCSNISKSFGEKHILKQVSFHLEDHEKAAIVGINGAGKSTLLKIIIGELACDEGCVALSKGASIGYLAQHQDLDSESTIHDALLEVKRPILQMEERIRSLELDMKSASGEGLENMLEEYSRLTHQFELEGGYACRSEITGVLKGLGFAEEEFTKPINTLSGGQKTRVSLGKLLLTRPDILFLDEPTNHLDIDTIEWLTNFLKNSKKTVLFITHDRYFLDNISTRIFELDRASLIEYQGNYQDYVRLKAEQDERDAALIHKKQQLYKQELTWMRRQPQARATKQQARINRFHDLKQDLSGQSSQTDLEMNFETSRIGKKVIEFKDVSFAFENKPILQDFNLLVQNKDRIGIVGDNGVGKSTLLNLIAERLLPQSGQVIIGETVRVAYFSQQIDGLDESKRVINFLQEVAEEVKTTVGTTSIADLLEQFLFPRSMHGTLIEKLSGGEKKRLFLLKLLIEKPNVLLLDEPTNDLDIATLTVLENFLQNFGGPVITVSHDRYFLDKVASKILAFENGSIREFFGNYTDYLDEKAFEAAQVTASHKVEKEKPVKPKEEKKRMSYMEKQEWASIEADIEAIENRIAEIEVEMNENGSDFGKLSALQKELDQENERLLEKYDRYEYLSELDE